MYRCESVLESFCAQRSNSSSKRSSAWASSNLWFFKITSDFFAKLFDYQSNYVSYMMGVHPDKLLPSRNCMGGLVKG
jgi:hypothetical protein